MAQCCRAWRTSLRSYVARTKSCSCPCRMACAARSCSLELMQWVLRCGIKPQKDLSDSLPYAARGGNVQCVSWLLQQGAQVDRETCSQATVSDSPAVVSLLHDIGWKGWGEVTVSRAAYISGLPCFRALASPGCLDRNNACDVVARVGCLRCLKGLYDASFPLQPILTRDITTKSVQCIAFALKHGCLADSRLYYEAIKNGRVDTMRALHEGGTKWDYQSTHLAAKKGALPCLQYLHEHGCEWHAACCDTAALHGHMDVLTYLHQSGCPWSEHVCLRAIESRSMEVLRYCHENGGLLRRSCCTLAARLGNLDLLVYLHEHGCPWSAKMWSVSRGHPQIEEYLRSECCPRNRGWWICHSASRRTRDMATPTTTEDRTRREAIDKRIRREMKRADNDDSGWRHKAEHPDAPLDVSKALAHIAARRAGHQQQGDLEAVVLVSSGSFAPVHRMHRRMMDVAKARVERDGRVVVAGFMSPSGDGYVRGKLGANWITLEQRLQMCKAVCATSDWVAVCEWGISMGRKVTQAVSETLQAVVPSEVRLNVLEIHGSDTLLRFKAWQQSKHYVGLYRQGYTEQLKAVMNDSSVAKNPDSVILMADEELPDFSSTRVRDAVVSGDQAATDEMLEPEVARIMKEVVVPFWENRRNRPRRHGI